jgi:crotonobetainyl-CoA:carnitine CoA-transferase CaiB-like acyl-CoA transferase
MTMQNPLPLDGVRVVEFGRRIAVGATGSLLAQLGAAVVFADFSADQMTERHGEKFEDKLSQRSLFAYGKEVVSLSQGSDATALQTLTANADVILISSDADRVCLPSELPKQAIVCDITAFGLASSGDVPLSDHLLQAMTGISDTTGEPNGPPVTIGAPVVEFTTALYSASAVLAALRVRRLSGVAQTIDMALYDCAVNAQATFLPAHFGGGKPRRLGNRHSMAAPWNAYRANDGWVLLCAASEPHWRKICDVIEKPELGGDGRYATLGDRMTRRDEVDALVSQWVAARSIEECVSAMSAANIACGPIVTIDELADEPNLRHREMIRSVATPDGGILRVPGNLFHAAAPLSAAISAAPRKIARTDAGPQLPLVGVRVIELGQYTTAPLVGRHLASLGAEVIKIEPIEGDSARQWAPHRNGTSYFFVMSNSGKRSLSVDLRNPQGANFFRRLLQTTDVLIENMKPGSLVRLGLSQSALAALNSRLVYVAITGFGADSAYTERPAFDTVVQAMCGIMDVTRSGRTPFKAGISIADISGGQLGLLSVLAGLELRDRTGHAPSYDLSMQDVGAWLTQLSWNGGRAQTGTIAKNEDGFVAVDADGRSERVQTVADVVAAQMTAARRLIVFSSDGWPLLGSPLRLSRTPPRVGAAISQPQTLSPVIEEELGLSSNRERATRETRKANV